MRQLIFGLAAALLLGAVAPPPARADVAVAASIAPIHALVAGVMGELGRPHLLVPGSGSPHHHALRPSDAEALQDARAVFWVGAGLETFLQGAIASLAGDAASVELAQAPGVNRLAPREGGIWEAHGHGDDHGPDEDGHAGHDDHDRFDPHVWLDPDNAAAMVGAIARALSDLDPANAAAYAANAQALRDRLAALAGEIDVALGPVRDTPFIVFHDGFQYFEHRFALAGAGSVTVDPEHRPGAERLAAIREAIAGRGAVCVFSEPQFETRTLTVLVEGSDARVGVLDPLGAAHEPGPELYFAMMRALAAGLAGCLGR